MARIHKLSWTGRRREWILAEGVATGCLRQGRRHNAPSQADQRGNDAQEAPAKVLCSLAVIAVCNSFSSLAWAQTSKPTTLPLGITTFLTGSASVFGIPGKAAAELWIEEFNAKGGLDGVKLSPVFIDEGLGGDKFLSEYRRVAQERRREGDARSHFERELQHGCACCGGSEGSGRDVGLRNRRKFSRIAAINTS